MHVFFSSLIWITFKENLKYKRNRYINKKTWYSTSQNFGHTFSFFAFSCFCYFLHCRVTLKTSTLWWNTCSYVVNTETWLWFEISWTSEWRQRSQHVLSFSGNSFKTQKNIPGDDRIKSVQTVVIKAKGGYPLLYEDIKIYSALFNTRLFTMCSFLVLMSSVWIHNVEMNR